MNGMTTRSWLTVGLGAVLALVGGVCLAADETIDRTVDASPDGTVSIELLAGRVEIVGWSKNAVRVKGTYGRDVEEIEIDVDDDEVSIEVELRRGDNLRHADADLTLSVPHGSSIEVETISAGIDVADVRGAIEIATVSGGVDVTGGSDEIEIATVSGGIDLRATGPIDDLELATVAGGIRYEGGLHRDADLSFESVSGSITVTLTGTLSADFSLATFSGTIDNEFGPKPEVAEFVPSQTLEFTEGRGSADVSIESFSGRIRLRRK